MSRLLALFLLLVTPCWSFRPSLGKNIPDLSLTTLTTPLIAASTALLTSCPALAADEYAELPPPYIPVLFGIGLIGGVGLLTSSLGNVIDQEASLGFQSGARAKREMERSRSSFFKKK